MQNPVVAGQRKPKLKPGDYVFARFHGEQEFQIIEKAICDSFFPHFKCIAWHGARYEYWILPQIHLASASIQTLTKESNRKQLNLL